MFASAAALTLGSHTVPVYEIYKAGRTPYWEPGLDLIAKLTGLPAVVIPHYDNAEGGHHDTRFCYLGERRLATLETELPEDAVVLGVDEHTAVILDLAAGTVKVLGNGGLTIRRRAVSTVYPGGTELNLADLARLAGPDLAPPKLAGSLLDPPFAVIEGGGAAANPRAHAAADSRPDSLRAAAEECRNRFAVALVGRDLDSAVAAALDLEEAISDWSSDTLSSDDGDHARGLLRSMMVELGDLARTGVADPADAIRPYVDLLITLRGRARDGKDFAASDEIRDVLVSADVELRDTPNGPTWSLARPE